MADLAHHFNIRPWEIDLLNIGEFIALCDSIDKIRG